METLLSLSNIERANEKAETDSWTFNCWGGTLYALNQTDILEWVDQCTMIDFLDDNTQIVDSDKLEIGDILALWINKYCLVLEHTAVYIGEGVFWHKVGGKESEFGNQEQIQDKYPNGKYPQIRRLTK